MREDTSKAGRVVGLFFKRDIARSVETANRIMNATYPGEDLRFVVGEAESAPQSDDFARMAFAVSIGGDGTFLRTARAVRDLGIPLFGVNTGRLGFLTSGTPVSAVDDVRRILAGEHRIVDRIPLKGEVLRGGTCIESLYALNEVAVVKDFPSRPIDLDIFVSSVRGGRLCRFLADGVIASTPTGSTAYALSAGGPIVHPDVKCLVIVPVCPHSLYLRPLILGENEVVEIRLEGESAGTSLSADGQLNLALETGDAVRLALDREKCVRVIRLDETSYYDALKSKFNWGSNGERDAPQEDKRP